jgi:hypothetical protein
LEPQTAVPAPGGMGNIMTSSLDDDKEGSSEDGGHEDSEGDDESQGSPESDGNDGSEAGLVD